MSFKGIHQNIARRMINFPFQATETFLKLTVTQLDQEIPASCGIRMFITVFSKTIIGLYRGPHESSRHSPSSLSLRPILISFSHIRLGLQNCSLPSGFPTNISCAF